LAGKIATDYVYQDLNAFVGDKKIPADRTKPWGTAHAVLCCKGKVNEPFAVINADDYYGTDAFIKAFDFLLNQCNEQTYCIVGYELKKTLSDFGSVSRGVCAVDANNNLTDINERTSIFRNEAGVITYQDEVGLHEVDEDCLVSMNYLCFAPGFIDVCETYFTEFLSDEKNLNNLKSEFFIPVVTGQFMRSGKGIVKVVPTSAQWFGVTYKEDAPHVQACINSLVEDGTYPKSLWA
jgi:hypothetical protein